MSLATAGIILIPASKGILQTTYKPLNPSLKCGQVRHAASFEITDPDPGKGLNLTCNVKFVLSGPNNAGDGVAPSHTDFRNLAATTISPGDLFFPTVLPEVVGPGDVQYDPATNTVKIVDLFVDTITPSDFRGDLVLERDSAGLIFDNESLPQLFAGGPCSMDGYLALPSPSGGTIAP